MAEKNYRKKKKQSFGIHLSFDGKGFYSSYLNSDRFLKEADRVCLHVIDSIIDYSVNAYHKIDGAESLVGLSKRERRRKFFESFLSSNPEKRVSETNKDDPKDFFPRLLRDFCEKGFNDSIRIFGVGEAISWFARNAVNWDNFSLCFSNSLMGLDYDLSLKNYLSKKQKNA